MPRNPRNSHRCNTKAKTLLNIIFQIDTFHDKKIYSHDKCDGYHKPSIYNKGRQINYLLECLEKDKGAKELPELNKDNDYVICASMHDKIQQYQTQFPFTPTLIARERQNRKRKSTDKFRHNTVVN